MAERFVYIGDDIFDSEYFVADDGLVYSRHRGEEQAKAQGTARSFAKCIDWAIANKVITEKEDVLFCINMMQIRQ